MKHLIHSSVLLLEILWQNLKHISIKQMHLLLALWPSLGISNVFRTISFLFRKKTKTSHLFLETITLAYRYCPFIEYRIEYTQYRISIQNTWRVETRGHEITYHNIMININSKTSPSLTHGMMGVDFFLQLLLFYK